MTQSIAIIGGGIVGSTAAYYLSRAGVPVTLFDEGTGQATKAAAGIICPWFSLRRNKPWYYLVSQGAEMYQKLLNDLEADNFDTQSLYQKNGTIILRRNSNRIKKDLNEAHCKKVHSPSMGEVRRISTNEIKDLLPPLETDHDGIFVEGGGRVDGADLIKTLQQAIVKFNGTIIREKAAIQPNNQGKTLVTSKNHSHLYDKVLLSVGAWLPQILKPLGYWVDIIAQKGQLFTINELTSEQSEWPVVMPYGQVDIIPNNDGTLTVGATHENEKSYNLDPDEESLLSLKEEAAKWIPEIGEIPIENVRVGTRAQTSDYSVLIGKVPQLENVWAISGLGSSGLTSGPFLGYQWSKLISEGGWDIPEDQFPIHNYIGLCQ